MSIYEISEQIFKEIIQLFEDSPKKFQKKMKLIHQYSEKYGIIPCIISGNVLALEKEYEEQLEILKELRFEQMKPFTRDPDKWENK